jgi:hypothetical protein
MASWRYGYWLSIIAVVLAAAYLLGVLAILLFDTFPPGEPFQSFIGAVTLLSVPVLVVLWVALRQALPADKRIFGTASLALIVIFGTLTSINRYVSLTVVPQALQKGQTEGLAWFQPYAWPSIMAAMEVLAWGFYLGLALLCLAPAFSRGRLERAIFWVLIVSGGLCLLAGLGQVLNNAALGMMGIVAWGPGLIILLALLAVWFKHGAQ